MKNILNTILMIIFLLALFYDIDDTLDSKVMLILMLVKIIVVFICGLVMYILWRNEE